MNPARKVHRPLFEGALSALNATFNDGHHADKVLERLLKENRRWGGRDRRFVAEAVYEVVRWWRRLVEVCGFRFESRTWTRAEIEAVLSAYLVVREFELPEWLEVAAGDRRELLRRWSQPSSRAARASIPDWLDARGESEFGAERWLGLLEALNHPAPIYLRTNRLKTSPDALTAALAREGISARLAGGDALVLEERANVFTTEAFKAGHFEVQDLSSQQVAPLLGAQAGERIIDACAGAGGKTLHLASLMGNKGKILSLDVHERKLEELKKRARRGGVDIIETRPISSQKVIKRLAATADRVLLDVPCSGLGVLRRNPDSKWKLTPESLENVIRLQAEILAEYSAMVKPGGVLVYATCSLLPSENRGQIERFLSQFGTEWELEKSLEMAPDQGGSDGFFAARLKRRS